MSSVIYCIGTAIEVSAGSKPWHVGSSAVEIDRRCSFFSW